MPGAARWSHHQVHWAELGCMCQEWGCGCDLVQLEECHLAGGWTQVEEERQDLKACWLDSSFPTGVQWALRRRVRIRN